MTNFVVLQKKAMNMARCLARSYGESVGCCGFFSVMIPKSSAMDDAITIGMLAESLDDTQDLIQYVQFIKEDFNLTLEDFNEFRKKVLIGMYLLKWFHYNSIVGSFIHKKLVDIFRNHLEVQSIEEINKNFLNSCLSEFSYFCTFIYARHEEKGYIELNERLGVRIQSDIHDAKQLVFKNDSSLVYGFYKEFIKSLGISMY